MIVTTDRKDVGSQKGFRIVVFERHAGGSDCERGPSLGRLTSNHSRFVKQVPPHHIPTLRFVVRSASLERC
jgi:hypothetical protein